MTGVQTFDCKLDEGSHVEFWVRLLLTCETGLLGLLDGRHAHFSLAYYTGCL